MEMSALRELTSDRRYWVGVGIVVKPSGEDHFEIDPDIGVLVNVELMPYKEPLLCRLMGLGEGGTRGLWRIPTVGSEVVVGIPGGELDNDPVLLGVLSSGGTPDELDGETIVIKGPATVLIIGAEVQVRAENAVLIIGAEVQIRSESGTAEPLITKSVYDAHVHPTGVGPSGVPNNTATSGTAVIKGE